VVVAPESDERLRVTLSTTGFANNRLTRLQVQSTANSAVEIASQAPQTGAFTIPLSNVGSFTFVIHRLTPAQPATVRMVASDACGDWTTLAGGGANGFP
jgi:hypothetical protein